MTKYRSVDVSSVITIDGWSDLDEALAGSRAKRSFIHPDTDDYYIFKEPNPKREALIWAELIASYIAGDLLEWPVQHVQIARKGERIGNLLRYIYDPTTQQMLAGERLCIHVDEHFDVKEGKRHTWGLITEVFARYFIQAFESNETRAVWTHNFLRYWARAIAFDTLISNSDRHAENWSLILPQAGSQGQPGGDLLAPLYDNGSSMGCEIDPVGLKKWFDTEGRINKSKLESYCNKGRHHISGPQGRYRFEDLCSVAIRSFKPGSLGFQLFAEQYEAVANLELSRLDVLFDDIMAMPGLAADAKFTPNRRRLVTELLRVGQDRVKRCLDQSHDT